MKNDIPAFDEIQKVRETLMEMSYKHWYYEDFLSLNWWFLLLSSLLPYFIWWKVVNKRRIFEIFTYGLLCGMTACVLDVMGVDMLLWAYPDKLFSLVPPLLPADLVIIPVTSMLIYQYFKTWKGFIAASIGLAFIFSFIIEPIFIKLHMFKLYNWKHIFSFLGFGILFLGYRFLVVRISKSAINKED